MIVSPISYPGNKAKLVSQIIPIITGDFTGVVDVFCGSGTVALNCPYKSVVCNDKSKTAVELLRYLYEIELGDLLERVKQIIDEYGLTESRIKPKGFYIEHKHEGLSLHNKEGFNRLKQDYNADHSLDKLFVLLIYGFNHYFRFNRKGEFNVPVGKVDFSESIYQKTCTFISEIKNKDITFLNKDFRDKSLYLDDTKIYYFDPPYLITSAPYNTEWNEEDEHDLLDLLDELNSRNIKFALSNVILSNGKTNELLKKWSEKYKIHYMRRQYRNASYQKKNVTDTIEVLVTNF